MSERCREGTHSTAECRSVAGKAHTAPLSHREGHSLLNGRIVPTVTFSMPVTTFTEDQCNQMNTVVNKVMLNKLGVHRNTPHAVTYTPLHMGGLNYPCFQIIQDQKGILSMLKHFRWNGTVGNDMLVVLSAVQLVSGLCEPIMEDVDSDLSYVAGGWFTHQRNRLRIMNGIMWIEHQWTPSLQREFDQSIMRAYIEGVMKGRLEKAN